MRQQCNCLDTPDTSPYTPTTMRATPKNLFLSALFGRRRGARPPAGNPTSIGAGEIFVPEMLVAAFTMKKGLDNLKPLLAGGGAASAGTILMATVKGDLHDIGKNVVGMMLEGVGFRVVDLGVDVDAEKVIRSIEEEELDILGFSSLLWGRSSRRLPNRGSAAGFGSWRAELSWTPPMPRGSVPTATAEMPWRWPGGS